jgi:Flp pilus assembly protein TadG
MLDSAKQIQRKPLSRRKRNPLLESVFTLLPTLALVFAFVDFGLQLSRWATLQEALREGCRYAITFQTVTGEGRNASIEAVVQQYGMGLVTTTDSPQHSFVNYCTVTNLNTPIASGGNVPGNIVQGSVQNISWAWLAPLSGSFGADAYHDQTPITLGVYSWDILGGYPAGVNSVQE